MKKINYFITALFSLLSATTMAQEKKSFTLEELIPGGNSYFQLSPENLWGLQWNGENICYYDMDNQELIYQSPNSSSKKSGLSLTTLNEALEKANLKKQSSLRGITFPPEMDGLLIHTPQYYALYKDGRITWKMPVDSLVSNKDFCPVNKTLAYTLGNNLWVANENGKYAITDEPAGIVCGQAVHRNEFGIMKGTFWSPKGTYLAFYRMDESMVTDYPFVNIDTRIATAEPSKYPMAGMTSHKVTIGVFQPATRKTVWLQAGDPTDRYFTNIAWSPDEKKIYVIELNRDQNHAQLVCYDAITGDREKVLLEETHPKYVEPMHPIIFLPWDAGKFIYQSQQDGFNHLYLYTTEGKLLSQLTTGLWLVQSVIGFNTPQKEIIFSSTENSPLDSKIWKVNIKNGKRTCLTPEKGVHQALLSPSGKYLIEQFNSPQVTNAIRSISTDKGHVQELLTASNPTEQYEMPEITVGTLKAADGTTDLYYRLVKPTHFDPSKKYPAIVYVYGGPHAQMIHNKRNYDARGWDIYMAQKGYVMFTLDNRGSENRGMEFENCTFRHLGKEEMKDQVKGAEFLKSLPYVDANRLGIHGWSFGGFMTTNLMLTYHDREHNGID